VNAGRRSWLVGRCLFHRRDRRERGEVIVSPEPGNAITVAFPEIPLTSFMGGRNVLSCAASDERWPQAGRIGGFRGCPAAQADQGKDTETISIVPRIPGPPNFRRLS
jgi:hypothetical protein